MPPRHPHFVRKQPRCLNLDRKFPRSGVRYAWYRRTFGKGTEYLYLDYYFSSYTPATRFVFLGKK